MIAQTPAPLKIFISYSHQNMEFKKEITDYLTGFTELEIMSDDLLRPGDDWLVKLSEFRDSADVFLLLVSQPYLQSGKVNQIEIPHIMWRADDEPVYVIPVILEHCNWQERPFARYQALPKHGSPLAEIEDPAVVFGEIGKTLLSIAQLKWKPGLTEILTQNKREKNPVLKLSEWGLDQIPRDLLDMPWITHLHLDRNHINEIENLDKLSELIHLNLSHNNIEQTDNLQHLSKLSFLDLEENRLGQLNGLDKLPALDTIGLSSNQLDDLTSLAGLNSLKTVYLARNGITDLASLGSLKNLKRVVLTDNRISSIRPLLELIRSGLTVQDRYSFSPEEEGIFIRGNPISDPSPDIIRLGREAILDHYTKLEDYGEEKLEILKVILIGNSGVGKTNFSQLLRGEPMNRQHRSTHVMDIKPWKARFLLAPNGEPMLVNIFDFGGQDYYHDLHQLYYSHDTAYVLLWDTSTNFYDEVSEQLDGQTTVWFEHYPVTYWLESIWYCLHGKEVYDYKGRTGQANDAPTNIPDLSTTAPVLVLQNKIDESKDGYPEEGLLDQQVLQKKYPNIATFYNLSLWPDPGKRLAALDDVLNTCFGKLNLSGRLLARPRHEVIVAYIDAAVDFEAVSIPQFKKRCQELLRTSDITLDEEDARAIASVLANLGYVYFDPAPEGENQAGEIVFTRLDTLNELIKEVMDIARRQHVRGIIRYDQVNHIRSVEHVLPLLVKNRSLIRLTENEYLAPQFLPAETDENIQMFLPLFAHRNVRYIYTAYFHKSLLMKIFHDFIRLSEDESRKPHTTVRYHYWRRGLMLSEEITDDTGTTIRNQSVFVYLIKEKDKCVIEIRTLLPFDREAGLERKVEALLDERNLGWTVEKEISLDSKNYFSVSELLDRAAKKMYSFREYDRNYSLHDFKYWVKLPELPKKLFISYSSKNSAFMLRLATHLEVLRIGGRLVPWYDRKIETGSKWDDAIKREMEGSDIIVLLLSPDFLATDYIRTVEIPMAIEHANKTGCRIFPIEVQPCSWEETEISSFQQNLKSGIPGKETIVINQADMDSEWKKIVGKLKEILG